MARSLLSCLLAVSLLSSAAWADTFHLTDPATEPGGTFAGAYWNYYNDPGAGSGAIYSFLRLQNPGGDGFEFGYNSSAQPIGDYDNVPGAHNRDLTLQQIPTKTIDGVEYRMFAFEVGEPGGGQRTLNLEKFVLIGDTMAGLNLGLDELHQLFDGTIGRVLYDLDEGGDNTVVMADVAPGNGRLDYEIGIPNSLFGDLEGSSYITLYVEISDAGGTFEEFAVFLPTGGGGNGGGGNGGGGGGGTPDVVPEPATLAIWSVLAAAGGACRLMRRRRAEAVVG